MPTSTGSPLNLSKFDDGYIGWGPAENTDKDTINTFASATNTALAGKAASVHTHAESDVTGLVADLAAKEAVANKDTDGTLAANSDVKYPSQKATKTFSTAVAAAAIVTAEAYTDSAVSGKENTSNKDTDGTLAANSDTKYASQKAVKTYIDTGLGTKAAVSHTHAESDVTGLVSDLAAKAPLASPALTGTPTAPTASNATNSTQIATTAFVHGVVSDVVGSAPAALDTLKELADAINDDASFAATVTTALSAKAPLASPALTGNPTAPTPSVDDNDTSIATTAFVIGQAAASGDGTPAMDGSAARGTSTHFARADHVHPVDTSRAASSHSHAASDITSGTLALARGGTNADLSASGGATKILAQDASHVVSARNLVAADIPTKFTLGGLPTLDNVSFTNVAPQIIGSGNIDLYTVPAGKRAIVSVELYNSTVGSITAFAALKRSSTYYRIGANVALATVTGSGLVWNGYVFEAGEVVALNTTATGLSARLNVILFDTSSALKSSGVVVTSGDNTVYTVPVGKTAIPVGQLGPMGSGNGPLFVWSNESGGALTYHWNAVPSGGSPSTTNQISTNAQSIANNALGTLSLFISMTAGEFLSINSSSTGQQFAFVTIAEQ